MERWAELAIIGGAVLLWVIAMAGFGIWLSHDD